MAFQSQNGSNLDLGEMCDRDSYEMSDARGTKRAPSALNSMPRMGMGWMPGEEADVSSLRCDALGGCRGRLGQLSVTSLAALPGVVALVSAAGRAALMGCDSDPIGAGRGHVN